MLVTASEDELEAIVLVLRVEKEFTENTTLCNIILDNQHRIGQLLKGSEVVN